MLIHIQIIYARYIHTMIAKSQRPGNIAVDAPVVIVNPPQLRADPPQLRQTAEPEREQSALRCRARRRALQK